MASRSATWGSSTRGVVEACEASPRAGGATTSEGAVLGWLEEGEAGAGAEAEAEEALILLQRIT